LSVPRSSTNPFKNSPNFIYRIAANPCAVDPCIFIETLAPAILFLLLRLIVFDLEDHIVDNSRRLSFKLAGARAGKRHSRGSTLRTGKRIAPKYTAGAVRFLFTPISIIEKIGWTMLLANFANDLAYTWTNIISRCEACNEQQNPTNQGPLEREAIPADHFLTAGFEGIRYETLVGNRAGWPTTLESVGLPTGSYTIICGLKFQQIQTGDVVVEARLRVNTTIAGFPVAFNADFQTYEVPEDQSTDLLLAGVVEVAPFATATVTWQWRIVDAVLPIVRIAEGRCIVQGRSTCSSLSPEVLG